MFVQWTFNLKDVKWRRLMWIWRITRMLKTSIDKKIMLHWLLKHDRVMDWIHVDPERTLWAVLANSLANIKNCGISWLGESSIWVLIWRKVSANPWHHRICSLFLIDFSEECARLHSCTESQRVPVHAVWVLTILTELYVQYLCIRMRFKVTVCLINHSSPLTL